MTIDKGKTKQSKFKITLQPVDENDIFYPEYFIISKTVEAVNNFESLYRTGRRKSHGGPSRHSEQDLYRAMLIFACAGLDVFVKHLTKTKLPQLIDRDKKAIEAFKEYVKRGIKKDDLNIIAVALIDPSPRSIFLQEYINSMTGDSLQSVDQLCRISNASGLNTQSLIIKNEQDLTEAFNVRNYIVHEMDIMIPDDALRTRRYRTRILRVSTQMEKHTQNIIKLIQDIFLAYKQKFLDLKIGIEKESKPRSSPKR